MSTAWNYASSVSKSENLVNYLKHEKIGLNESFDEDVTLEPVGEVPKYGHRIHSSNSV